VRLRVWVDELGRAGQVLLATSSGWRLFDDAAMAQARRCPFHPAQRGSEPIGSWVEFPVRFALESSSNG
jgi:protein TonB